MVLPNERNDGTFATWGSAATLASAIVALGLVMSWPVEQAQTPQTDWKLASEPCTGGDEVSNFVCRNGWIASLAHHYR
jgi:hypothetical protein